MPTKCTNFIMGYVPPWKMERNQVLKQVKNSCKYNTRKVKVAHTKKNTPGVYAHCKEVVTSVKAHTTRIVTAVSIGKSPIGIQVGEKIYGHSGTWMYRVKLERNNNKSHYKPSIFTVLCFAYILPAISSGHKLKRSYINPCELYHVPALLLNILKGIPPHIVMHVISSIPFFFNRTWTMDLQKH